jgi:hypothetical protein
MSYKLTPAVRVEIRDDYPLVKAMFDWLLNDPVGTEVNARSLRGGFSGQGAFSGDFLAEDMRHLLSALERMSSGLEQAER